MTIVADQFTTTGVSDVIIPESGSSRGAGQFNILLAGAGVGDTVQLERAFADAPTTFFAVKEYDAIDANEVGAEPEVGVLYRFNCTALAAAGPVTYRLST